MIAFVKNISNIKLDMKEVVDYKWLNLDEFVNLIKWDDNKEVLKDVLKKALKKEKYFNKLKIIDYRK